MALALKQPEQSPEYSQSELTFSKLVKQYLAKNRMTQKELAVAANLSEPMISRILRNSNRRGDSFKLTDEIVTQLALALKIGISGRDKLLQAAFPQRAYWLEALAAGENVISLNSRLCENELPMLGIDNPIE